MVKTAPHPRGNRLGSGNCLQVFFLSPIRRQLALRFGLGAMAYFARVGTSLWALRSATAQFQVFSESARVFA